jgi:8-oxo-dGTP pyrophosphatase MutT (NUDIX family)
VPRPPGARPGAPPPWEALPGAARSHVPLAAVVAALEGLRDGGEPADWAVLVPLFERAGEAHVVLTRRARSLRRNPGQVAFPGGRRDEGEGLLAAALREAAEEVSLDASLVTCSAPLGVAPEATSDRLVGAFAAVLAEAPLLRPNAAEVEAVLEVPLVALLAPGAAWSERWTSPGRAERTLYFFADGASLGDDLVWGLTARLLWALLERVAAALPGLAAAPALG